MFLRLSILVYLLKDIYIIKKVRFGNFGWIWMVGLKAKLSFLIQKHIR